MFSEPFTLTIIGLILGYLGKYVWDRFLAQSARITRNEFLTALDSLSKECQLRRESCVSIRASNKTYFEHMFKEQHDCLEGAIEAEGTTMRRRGETRKALVLIMMTQIKICEALRLDCADLAKMLVEMGGVE